MCNISLAYSHFIAATELLEIVPKINTSSVENSIVYQIQLPLEQQV